MRTELSSRIAEAMDSFIAQKLELTEPSKREIIKFVLSRTRMHVQTIIDAGLKADSGIEGLVALCQALDSAPATYHAKSLAAAGAENLDSEIIEYRHKVKWNILVDELRDVIPDDGSIITPDRIKNANRPLYNALRSALNYSKKLSSNFDWELLKEHLPADLASRFETKKLSKAERKLQIEEDTHKTIEDLNLADVVAGLGKDPKKLAYYLQLTGQLSDEQRNRIVYVSFSGLREAQTETKLNRMMAEYQESLGPVEVLSEVPFETDKNRLVMKVRVPEGTDRLLVRGPWKRDIKINGSRVIEFSVILNPGTINLIQLLAYNEADKSRSPLNEEMIQQTSEVADKSTLVDFLRSLDEKMLADIESDETKKEIFRKLIEESSIRDFAGDFARGKTLMERDIKTLKSQFVVNTLKSILQLFEGINKIELPFIREDEHLMFFQKYCVYKMEEKRKAGSKGVILANEPGLGKTLNALAFAHGHETLVVTPNSAASTWIEQEARFFKQPFLLSLAGRSFQQRMALLRKRNGHTGVVTNVEFVRKKEGDKATEDDGKLTLLNQRIHAERQRVLVIDEAHFLKNDSQQTEGISQLDSDFMLLLTASPYRTSGALCRIMHKIFPDDVRFSNVAAFEEAYPANDPAKLKMLHSIVNPHVVRFLKSEVMPTYDRTLPLAEQPLSLPAKKYIDPYETGIGEFTLTIDQEMAMMEMFEDWQAWAEKYDRYMPSDDAARADGIRASDDRLTKEHAMRQLVNNPRYINSELPSPKHEAAMKIVDKEISEGKKGIIFCRYHEEVEAYAKLLTERGIGFTNYTGAVTKLGYKKDDDGREILYSVDNFGNYIFDENGEPRIATDSDKGRSMLAADYERLIYQNNPSKKVKLATYSAGSQSVTFTAADFMIFDDMPKDYIEQYQAEDRNHRIDEKRPKYEVRYYTLASKHSKEFLEFAREYMITDELSAYDKWFSQGTMDRVQHGNLQAQRTSFELLNNGIAVDPDLVEDERPFNI